MHLLSPDEISALRHRAESHAVFATEAAAIAFELMGQRHWAEAALIRASARNHRIRQLEILANIEAAKALFVRHQPSRA
jgi:hypothetical protein